MFIRKRSFLSAITVFVKYYDRYTQLSNMPTYIRDYKLGKTKVQNGHNVLTTTLYKLLIYTFLKYDGEAHISVMYSAYSQSQMKATYTFIFKEVTCV
jgi:hypothetical protein